MKPKVVLLDTECDEGCKQEDLQGEEHDRKDMQP
jgi:hypothetical protein